MSDATNTPLVLVNTLMHVEFCVSLVLIKVERLACVNGVVFSAKSTSL